MHKLRFVTTNFNGADDLHFIGSVGAEREKEERALRMLDVMLQNLRINIVLNSVNNGKLLSVVALVRVFHRNRTKLQRFTAKDYIR